MKLFTLDAPNARVPNSLGGNVNTVPNTSTIKAGTHNKRLKAALTALEQQAAAARSDIELTCAIAALEAFPTPVAYDNSLARTIATCVSAALVVTAAILQGLAYPPEYAIAAICGALLPWAVYWILVSGRKNSLESLSRTIAYKSSLFDYGLKEQRLHPTGKARELGGEFPLFRQGNHSREVRLMLSGTQEGTDHSFAYDYFHFHYVNKRTETYTTTDSKGRTRVRTRTVYDHFDRYGFITDFPYAKDIHIAEGGLGFFTSGYKTSSVSFNKRFGVEATSDMVAAKFLTPKIIQEIEAAGEALLEMDLYFGKHGKLCFSYGNNSTFATIPAAQLTDPKAFKEVISGHNSQHGLDSALTFLHTLMKYSDNNFDIVHKTQPEGVQ
ncbi:hypothetical protein [Kordiimonas pumila]|uniref:Galanin n=1 Tax=Kordiimonas pumila TaxID=2161677 RepID=A0ABV7D699_9PROT|nr:hypothetical protein [Kordiimonas pumila]